MWDLLSPPRPPRLPALLGLGHGPAAEPPWVCAGGQALCRETCSYLIAYLVQGVLDGRGRRLDLSTRRHTGAQAGRQPLMCPVCCARRVRKGLEWPIRGSQPRCGCFAGQIAHPTAISVFCKACRPPWVPARFCGVPLSLCGPASAPPGPSQPWLRRPSMTLRSRQWMACWPTVSGCEWFCSGGGGRRRAPLQPTPASAVAGPIPLLQAPSATVPC